MRTVNRQQFTVDGDHIGLRGHVTLKLMMSYDSVYVITPISQVYDKNY
jgi:hypothetical protein